MGLSIKEFKQTSRLKNDNLILLEQQDFSKNTQISQLAEFVKSNVNNFESTNNTVTGIETSVLDSETNLKQALAKYEELKELMVHLLSEKGYETTNNIDSILRSLKKLDYTHKSAISNGISYITIGGKLYELHLDDIVANVRGNKIVVALCQTYLNEKHKVTAIYNGIEYVLSSDNDTSLFTVFIKEYTVPQELVGQSFEIKVEVAGQTVITDINTLKEDEKLAKWIQVGRLPKEVSVNDCIKHDNKVYFEYGKGKLGVMNDTTFDGYTELDIPNNQISPNLCLVNDSIYAIGGINDNKNVSLYNITLGTWSNVSSLIQAGKPSIGLNNCVYKDNYIYCFFDGENKSSNTMKYNIVTNTWSLIPDTNKYLSTAKPIVYKDKIYLIGGFANSSEYSNEIKLYNELTHTYTVKRILKYKTGYAGATVFNDKIILVGGKEKNEKTNRVFEYNPASNKLKELIRMYYPSDCSFSYSQDNGFVVFGGIGNIDGVGQIYPNIYKYELF